MEYEELPFVVDHADALKPGAPAVHDGGNRVRETRPYVRGDVDQGFAGADTVLERTYRTSCEIHTPMEVHGSVARWDGDRLTVWDSNQGVFDIRNDLARALGLPLTSVRMICHYMGGGFGGKLDLGKYTVIAALLARRTARPVKLCLTREETFLCAGNRPDNTLVLKAGVKKDGTLTALALTAVGSAGAYPAGATSGYLVADLYRCPNVRVEETGGLHQRGPGARVPGAGVPAVRVGARADDGRAGPRHRHGPDRAAAEERDDGQPGARRAALHVHRLHALPHRGRRGVRLDGGARPAARRRPRRPRRGRGRGMWGYAGNPTGTVIVKYFSDGSVNLCMGASDIGTGTKTVMAMVVAEELGVPLDRIQIDHADTGTTPYAVPVGRQPDGARQRPGRARRRARREAPAARARRRAARGAGRVARAARATIAVAAAPAARRSRRWPSATCAQLERQQVIVGVGRRAPHPAGKVALPFAAQFAEVEVDTRTGEVRVLRLVGAHDSGRPMNRLTFENQVFGGITMGVGFGMTEGRVLDRQTGRMVNANWHDYKIPTALDVPRELACVPIDPHDTECNSVGAKGLGEPATIPTAAAIANAVFHATGVRLTDDAHQPDPAGPEAGRRPPRR